MIGNAMSAFDPKRTSGFSQCDVGHDSKLTPVLLFLLSYGTRSE